MAGFAEMLQRLARELEQADAQRPEDDLRARLGYGSADDVDGDTGGVDEADAPESESIWGPAAVREAEAARRPAVAREPVAPQAAASRAPGAADRAPPSPSPAASPRPRPSGSPAAERIRARLRTPDALREAFVVKALLDRPPGLRRR